MTVRVNLDPDNDIYQLGDDVDGVFIAFATVPGTDVRSRVESIQAANDRAAAASNTTATTIGGAPATTGGAASELDAAHARIAELEAELAARQAGGGGA